MRVLLVASLAMACAAPAVVVVPEEETPVDPHEPLVLETWNTSGTARNEPSWPARLAGVSAHLAQGESDVVCVQGLLMQADRDAVLTATKSVYPYAAYRDTDRTTIPDDLHDLTGAIPKAQTTPPCSAADDAAWTTVEACVRERRAGRDVVELAAVIPSCDLGRLAPRCESCFVGSLMSRPLDDLRGDCFTRPDGALAFEGRTDALILSKRPLSDVRYHVSPGLVLRGSMIEATIRFGARKAVIACASPTREPLPYATHLKKSPVIPYAGDYAAPLDPSDPNATFVNLFNQVERFVRIALARTDGPVFLLGDATEGIHLDTAGRLSFTDAMDWYLASNFDRLTAFEDGLGCLRCHTNPLTKLMPGTPGDFISSYILVTRQAPVTRVSVERTATDATVPSDTASTPPSPFFGLRVSVAPQ